MLSRLFQHIDAGTSATDFSVTLLDYVSMLNDEIMQPLLERLYREMNISVSDVVDVDNDLETTITPTDAEIWGFLWCAPITSDESENEDYCGDELERVTQSEVTSCLERFNVYIMQANESNESVTPPFLKFKAAIEGHKNYAKKQTKITLCLAK